MLDAAEEGELWPPCCKLVRFRREDVMKMVGNRSVTVGGGLVFRFGVRGLVGKGN